MPYLQEKDKLYYDSLLILLKRHAIETPGELNFLLTEVCKQAMNEKSVNYTLLNGIMGALESCKQEFYRRIVAPYEDKKIKSNGDVYSCNP